MGGSGGRIRTRDPQKPPRKVGDGDPCERLRIETNIMSPNDEVMKTVHSGDVLSVSLQHSQTRRYVVVSDANGRIVGTVGSEQVISLIECIDKGHVYKADVLSVEGGACRISIHKEGR